jgi:hypothetical protein
MFAEALEEVVRVHIGYAGTQDDGGDFRRTPEGVDEVLTVSDQPDVVALDFEVRCRGLRQVEASAEKDMHDIPLC